MAGTQCRPFVFSTFQRHDALRGGTQILGRLRGGGRKAGFAYLPPQLRRTLRRGADEVPVKGVFTGGDRLYRDGVGRIRSAGRKVVGADAHGGAARRDGQHQPQGGVPAVQTDGVTVQRGAGQNVLAAGQPRGSDALRVGKNGLGGTGTQHLPSFSTIISLQRR